MNSSQPLFTRTALSLSLALALAACGGSSEATGNDARAAAPAVAAASPAPLDRDQLVDEIAANLQACSYDGAPVKVSPRLGEVPSSDCRDMVSQIMRFTGLPQNFDVVEAPVPNAAAVILLDEQKLPHRVIAFNPDFINVVQRETGGNAWAPVSIMAHEIGHHLSGHTIQPGGSQPPTELEADKFSGFVLYKMGATLDDAQKAMATFVPEGPDGPTHPGRGKRLSAISEGWEQACAQIGGGDCKATAQGAPLASPAPNTGTTSRLPTVPGPSDAPIATTTTAPSKSPLAAEPTAAGVRPSGSVDVLPAPGTTPSKFSQFVYDEFGVLDRAKREEVEKAMYTLAKDKGVELVTILTKDTHGLSAQDYAYAMMRQLRVGKLDVGNGAVMVVAPNQKDVAIAMGPGVTLEMHNYLDLDTDRLRSFLEMGWTNCLKKGCGLWTENFFGATEHIAHDTGNWEWTVRYQSLDDIIAAIQETTIDYDPEKDPTWRKITRIKATVTDLTPDADSVNPHHEELVGGKAMRVRADNGRDVMLYVNSRIPSLMPGGIALEEGKTYAFVTREQSVDSDTPAFDLLSYDLAP